MDVTGEPNGNIGITTLLVGALTGHNTSYTEADRQAVGEWMVNHVDSTAEVRDLLHQDRENSDWRYFRVPGEGCRSDPG